MEELEGNLFKMGDNFLKSFKQRWFKLGNDGRLYYFNNKGDDKENGFIDITQVISITAANDESAMDARKKGFWEFNISIPGRVYKLRSTSEVDMNRWVDGLKKTMNLVSNMPAERPKSLQLSKPAAAAPPPGSSNFSVLSALNTSIKSAPKASASTISSAATAEVAKRQEENHNDGPKSLPSLNIPKDRPTQLAIESPEVFTPIKPVENAPKSRFDAPFRVQSMSSTKLVDKSTLNTEIKLPLQQTADSTSVTQQSEPSRAVSPRGQEPSRAISPRGQESSRVVSPRGQEPSRAISPRSQEASRVVSPRLQEPTTNNPVDAILKDLGDIPIVSSSRPKESDTASNQTSNASSNSVSPQPNSNTQQVPAPTPIKLSTTVPAALSQTTSPSPSQSQTQSLPQLAIKPQPKTAVDDLSLASANSKNRPQNNYQKPFTMTDTAKPAKTLADSNLSKTTDNVSSLKLLLDNSKRTIEERDTKIEHLIAENSKLRATISEMQMIIDNHRLTVTEVDYERRRRDDEKKALESKLEIEIQTRQEYERRLKEVTGELRTLKETIQNYYKKEFQIPQFNMSASPTPDSHLKQSKPSSVRDFSKPPQSTQVSVPATTGNLSQIHDNQTMIDPFAIKEIKDPMEYWKRPAATWVDDTLVSNCGTCQVPFGWFVGRHHCRNCGNIFCDTCSSFLHQVPGYDRFQRVCQPCLAELKKMRVLLEDKRRQAQTQTQTISQFH